MTATATTSSEKGNLQRFAESFIDENREQIAQNLTEHLDMVMKRADDAFAKSNFQDAEQSFANLDDYVNKKMANAQKV